MLNQTVSFLSAQCIVSYSNLSSINPNAYQISEQYMKCTICAIFDVEKFNSSIRCINNHKKWQLSPMIYHCPQGRGFFALSASFSSFRYIPIIVSGSLFFVIFLFSSSNCKQHTIKAKLYHSKPIVRIPSHDMAHD